MSEETKKNLTEFDHYLIHAAIEQYDQKKYDSVTVDTCGSTSYISEGS